MGTFGIIAYSYQEFRVGKKSKKDVILFEQDVKNNLLNLQKDLVEKTNMLVPLFGRDKITEISEEYGVLL